MDCKKALTEAEGDFVKAEKILKELGLAAAAKRGGRATNEGRIFTYVGADKAGILELSCETDFVARNEAFVELGEGLVHDIVKEGLAKDDEKLGARVTEAASVIKENMAIRRVDILTLDENEIVVPYIHGESGNIGVLVKLKLHSADAAKDEKATQFAFDVALHVAAFNPAYLAEASVPAAYMTEQEEIFTKQAQNLGKPEKVIAGIVKGKIRKHLAEITLLNQPFVKDDKRSVTQVANDIAKELGGPVEITDFRYFSVGEELDA